MMCPGVHNVACLCPIFLLEDIITLLTHSCSTSGALSVFKQGSVSSFDCDFALYFLSPGLLEDAPEKQFLIKSFSGLTLPLKCTLELRDVCSILLFSWQFFHHKFPLDNSPPFSYSMYFKYKRVCCPALCSFLCVFIEHTHCRKH